MFYFYDGDANADGYYYNYFPRSSSVQELQDEKMYMRTFVPRAAM